MGTQTKTNKNAATAVWKGKWISEAVLCAIPVLHMKNIKFQSSVDLLLHYLCRYCLGRIIATQLLFRNLWCIHRYSHSVLLCNETTLTVKPIFLCRPETCCIYQFSISVHCMTNNDVMMTIINVWINLKE